MGIRGPKQGSLSSNPGGLKKGDLKKYSRPERTVDGCKPFLWTPQAERAAFLLAEGKMSLNGIGADPKVSCIRSTLTLWRTHPEFNQYVDELREELVEQAKQFSILERESRLAALQHDFDATQLIIHERANDPTMADVPGGKSGLVDLADIKKVGDDIYRIYKDNRGLIETRKGLLQQAAQELGEWSTKTEVSGETTQVVMTLAERAAALKELEEELRKQATPEME